MNLEKLEIELKKRWQIPYDWKGTKQTNVLDQQTNFIYKINTFDELQKKIQILDNSIQNYALNRWYNFWSAKGVEYIFSTHQKVKPNTNKFDKLIDFKIDEIPFDHKTSVFPKGYSNSIEKAIKNPNSLIEWLYSNQSSESRQHFKNRLFLILFDKNGEHWKLKAEIGLFKKTIENYILNFESKNLMKIKIGEEGVFSDIVWIIK